SSSAPSLLLRCTKDCLTPAAQTSSSEVPAMALSWRSYLALGSCEGWATIVFCHVPHADFVPCAVFVAQVIDGAGGGVSSLLKARTDNAKQATTNTRNNKGAINAHAIAILLISFALFNGCSTLTPH